MNVLYLVFDKKLVKTVKATTGSDSIQLEENQHIVVTVVYDNGDSLPLPAATRI